MEHLFHFLDSIYPLPEPLKEHLSSVLRQRTYPKKSFLLKAGQVCRTICFVTDGLVRCFYEKDLTEVSSWFMKEGDVIISVESFFNQRVSIESIQALEDCQVYSMEYGQLQHVFRTFPEFNFIGRILTERYYTLCEQRLYSLRMQKSRERYNYLVKNHPELILRVPSKHIASYLGVSRETLSRIRSEK